jgi:hypothetical protein
MFRVFRTFQLKDGIPQVLKSDEQLWAGLLRLGRQYYRHTSGWKGFGTPPTHNLPQTSWQ